MDIQGLKDKILQLAIQGKLVEQNPEDEPASVLLERIMEERDNLVKEGKIRKPKKLPPIEEEEKPFDIPKGWEWVRLGEVGDWGSGATPKRSNPKYYENGTIPWLKTGELNDGYIKYSEEHITEEAVKETSVRMNQIGDVLIAMYGATIGRLGILEIEATTNQACCACTPFMGVFNRYLFYYLLSQRKSFKDKSEGGAQPNISKEKIVNHFFPLPPLSEQKRIVEKVDELFALIDELDSNKEDLLEVINLTRNQVLQEAIQGKLVEQNPEDEPASALVQRIKEERDKLVREGKIRKPKKLPPIEEEEKPFEIPGSWEWVRLGEVAQFINGDRGKNYPSKKELVESGIPFINAGHLNNSEIELVNMNYITDEKFESLSSGKIQIKDIIYCLRGTLGKCSINKKIEKGAIASSLVIIRNYVDIYEKYIYYYLVSPLSKYMIKKYDNGTAQPNLSAESVRQYSLPLPPLTEQKRIVEKVDMIMNMFDELENEIVINI